MGGLVKPTGGLLESLVTSPAGKGMSGLDPKVMRQVRKFGTESDYYDKGRPAQDLRSYKSKQAKNAPFFRSPSDFLKDWAKKYEKHLQFERISPVFEQYWTFRLIISPTDRSILKERPSLQKTYIGRGLFENHEKAMVS